MIDTRIKVHIVHLKYLDRVLWKSTSKYQNQFRLLAAQGYEYNANMSVIDYHKTEPGIPYFQPKHQSR